MALQVEDTLAGNRPQFGLLDRMEPAAAFAQHGQIVAARAEMNADLLVPMSPVDRAPRRLAHDRCALPAALSR